MRHKIFGVLAILALGWMGGACSSEELHEPSGGVDGDGVPTLAISIGVAGATRADDDPAEPDFELGTGLENYLDIAGDDYRIYFFDFDENTYLATFTPTLKPAYGGTHNVVDPSTGVETVYYHFWGKVPDAVTATKFKLVFLANWGKKYPEEAESAADGEYKLVKGKTTIADIVTNTSAQFTHLNPGENEPWLSQSDRLIPFYGVRAYDVADYVDPSYISSDGKIKGDIYIDLSKELNSTKDTSIPLIRAMAKVEVILDNAFASFSKVEMTKVNRIGFCAPYQKNNWNFDYRDYFHDYTWGDDFVHGVHLTYGATTGNKGEGTNDQDPRSLQFKKVWNYGDKDDDGNGLPEKWVAYVPEFQNIGVGDNFTAITVELNKPDNVTDEEWAKTEKSNLIYFAPNGSATNNEDGPVETTKRYNIERNNIYRFTITGMNANLNCQVDIQPFAEQKLEMEFGLMRDERGDLMVIPDSKGDLPKYFTEYMKGRVWPKDKDGNDLRRESGDYYAIVLGEDGKIGSNQTEIWLKDSEGCRVLSNLANKDDNSQECSTRTVIHFFGLDEIEYNKDTQGERRLHHYNNHCSIVLDKDGTKIFKNPENTTRYKVESWDETDCWIISKEVISTDKKTITTTLILIDSDGNLSNTTKEITEDYFEFKPEDGLSQ